MDATHIRATEPARTRLNPLRCTTPISPSHSPSTRTSPLIAQVVDVYPEAGRLAMFYSADCPHEVQLTIQNKATTTTTTTTTTTLLLTVTVALT